MDSDSPRPPGRRRQIVAAALVALALAAAVQRSWKRQALFEAQQPHMGTGTSLTLAARSEEIAAGHFDAAFARIRALEAALSAQQETSDLARVNRAAGGDAVPVPDDLFRAIRCGVEWHARSGGVFDIAVGPLIALWAEHGHAGTLPSDEEVAAARALTGADRVVLDPAARTVRLPVAGMRLHLGGLGKGFTAEEVAATLRARGVSSALVAMAGDIAAVGRRPDGAPWRVGVQDPRHPDDPRALLTVVELADAAISTSGDYRRFTTIAGHRYSHILDPRTGRPVEGVCSVTVIAPDAVTTDILGTALSVLGVAEGTALVASLPGVAVLFAVPDGEDLRLVRTGGFERYESRAAAPTDAAVRK